MNSYTSVFMKLKDVFNVNFFNGKIYFKIWNSSRLILKENISWKFKIKRLINKTKKFEILDLIVTTKLFGILKVIQTM